RVADDVVDAAIAAIEAERTRALDQVIGAADGRRIGRRPHADDGKLLAHVGLGVRAHATREGFGAAGDPEVHALVEDPPGAAVVSDELVAVVVADPARAVGRSEERILLALPRRRWIVAREGVNAARTAAAGVVWDRERAAVEPLAPSEVVERGV